jgi:hypothetical protein
MAMLFGLMQFHTFLAHLALQATGCMMVVSVLGRNEA